MPTVEMELLEKPAPPAWVEALVPAAALQPCPQESSASGTVQCRSGRHGELALTQVVVPAARNLPGEQFRDRVTEAYTTALRMTQTLEARHPLRWWNYVPGIERWHAPQVDWYMLFNAGRHEALRRWFGDEHFDGRLATASAVGTSGNDFVIHVLTSTTPGVPLENPRQIPAYHYSRRYGPCPPSFARATAVAPAPGEAPLAGRLLIGGTASIVGEATCHQDALDAQIDETCRNLAALLAAWKGATGQDQGLLSGVRHARVYILRPQDHAPTIRQLRDRLPHLERLEVMSAALCRHELLVEIEGLAW